MSSLCVLSYSIAISCHICVHILLIGYVRTAMICLLVVDSTAFLCVRLYILSYIKTRDQDCIFLTMNTFKTMSFKRPSNEQIKQALNSASTGTPSEFVDQLHLSKLRLLPLDTAVSIPLASFKPVNQGQVQQRPLDDDHVNRLFHIFQNGNWQGLQQKNWVHAIPTKESYNKIVTALEGKKWSVENKIIQVPLETELELFHIIGGHRLAATQLLLEETRKEYPDDDTQWKKYQSYPTYIWHPGTYRL